QKDFRHRQAFLLVLQGLGGQPIIDLLLAAPESTAWVSPPQHFEPVTCGEADAAHDSPRMTAPSSRWAGVSFGVSLSAFQSTSCSSGDNVIVCSLEARTSRRAWATSTVRT